MVEIKDKKLAEQIKKNPVAKRDFEALLKKAGSTKPKSSPKQSKT
jgi:hypothetical protein